MRSPLAVIGMACRLPGGTDTPAQFWELLKNGKDVIGDLPDDRWDVHAWHHPDPAAPGQVRNASKGGFRENLDLFDADFFGISPREAGRMDPSAEDVAGNGLGGSGGCRPSSGDTRGYGWGGDFRPLLFGLSDPAVA